MPNQPNHTESTEQALARCLQAGHDRILFHFENTSIGYIEWGPQMQALFMSNRAEQILGLSLQEFTAKKMTAFSQVYPDDLPAVKEMIGKFSSGELDRMHIQNRNVALDGKVIWCDWYNSVLKDKGGKLIAVISLVQDITASKEDRVKIKRASHLYSFISQVNQKIVRVKTEKELFRNACDIALAFGQFKMAWIGLYHPVGNKISVADQSGIPAEDMSPFKSLSFQPNDPWDRVRVTGHYYICNEIDPLKMAICNPFEKSNSVRSCMILPIKKGSTVFGTISLYSTDAAYFNPQEIALLLEVTDDISFAVEMLADAKHHKAIAARMLKSDQQREFDQNNLEALINNTKDLLWSVDTEFKLITFNEPFSEMIWAMSNHRIEKGKTVFYQGFSDTVLDLYKSAYNRAFTGEAFTETVHTQYPFELWSEISYSPITNNGQVIGAACHSRDVTAAKIAELERIRITNDLIQRNKNLEQFGYIISHNLRSPVANILGVTQLMNKPALSPEEKNILAHGLTESVTKLDNVVKDLTDVLQFTSEKNWIKENIFFSELVEDVKSSIHHLIKAIDIDIRYDFTAINEFLTVKSYCYSIFYNLISNSIKYRQPGVNAIIRISSFLEGSVMGLIFSDNGLGIDLEKRGAQVFGLYKRFHPHIEGKGMGLFMVKTQVETLGGKISLESTVNQGTKFKIEFER